MAEGKKTFIFYSDWINMVREMPNEQAGELLKHVLSYVNDENPETNDILVRMAFAHMKPMLKKDLSKWEEIRAKRKKAGSKGGKQTQANAKQVLEGDKQVQAVNDNVNVNVDTKVSLYGEKEFLEDWGVIRKKIKNLPTHITKLKFNELEDLKKEAEHFDRSQFQEAMRGLFSQEVIKFNAMITSPKHFLENVGMYYNAFHGKDFKLYGSKPIEY